GEGIPARRLRARVPAPGHRPRPHPLRLLARWRAVERRGLGTRRLDPGRRTRRALRLHRQFRRHRLPGHQRPAPACGLRLVRVPRAGRGSPPRERLIDPIPPDSTEAPMDTLAGKRATFRRMHERGFFLLPNAWDRGSAVRLVAMGFEAIASTSSGAAWAAGREDGELSLDEVLEHLR